MEEIKTTDSVPRPPRPLEYANGYFMVINKDMVLISETCPPDIRKRLEEDWPKVKAETEERHRAGFFSSLDYF